MKSVRRDIRQDVTDSIVKMIEEDGIAPWQKPWGETGERMMPHNFATKHSYSGVNVPLLWMSSIVRGFNSQAWLTYKQANTLGGRIKRGAKSVRCCYFKRQVVNDDETPEGTRTVPVLNTFNLFNIEDVSGVKLDSLETEPEASHMYVMQSYLAREGIQIVTSGSRAYYNARTDVIGMPPVEDFNQSQYGYDATLAHEMVHSTGHMNRLDRLSTKPVDRRSPQYCFEELVAELGSAMFCAEFGIDSTRENSASYIKSYLEGLKNDKRFIFEAASAASRATNLIIGEDWVATGHAGISADEQ